VSLACTDPRKTSTFLTSKTKHASVVGVDWPGGSSAV
jgi:hypothetical protein